MPIQASSKSTEHKKAQHPVGLFYIFDAFGITPVVPAFSVAVFSYFYLEHPALYVLMIRNKGAVV
jgi:hypothetical protein